MAGMTGLGAFISITRWKPERMEINMGDTNGAHNHIELVRVGSGLHRATLQGGDYKTLPSPRRAEGILHHILPSPQLAKRSPGFLRQVELSVGVAGLRVPDRDSRGLPFFMADDLIIPIIFFRGSLISQYLKIFAAHRV